jgi:hypothetical protein
MIMALTEEQTQELRRFIVDMDGIILQAGRQGGKVSPEEIVERIGDERLVRLAEVLGPDRAIAALRGYAELSYRFRAQAKAAGLRADEPLKNLPGFEEGFAAAYEAYVEHGGEEPVRLS